MRVVRRLVQEQVVHHHAFHRREAGGDVLACRDRTARCPRPGCRCRGTSHPPPHRSCWGCAGPAPDPASRPIRSRRSRAPPDWRCAGSQAARAGSEPMSQLPCTLFWPRSGFTPTPRPADIAGRHREIGQRHHRGGALAVLGHAQPVVDRAVARRWRRAAPPPRIVCAGTPLIFATASGLLRCFGDEARPVLRTHPSRSARARSPRPPGPR